MGLVIAPWVATVVMLHCATVTTTGEEETALEEGAAQNLVRLGWKVTLSPSLLESKVM
jgi:hypothetical protein